jgi:hypothetical protein
MPDEIKKMHMWIRSVQRLIDSRPYVMGGIERYQWKWISARNAYLVSFRFFARKIGGVKYVEKVYAFITCSQHAACVKNVWIYTLHEMCVDWDKRVEDLWQYVGGDVIGPDVSISTRYNVGHHLNLESLLFDFDWGTRRTHDITDEMQTAFTTEDVIPQLFGCDDDGWRSNDAEA